MNAQPAQQADTGLELAPHRKQQRAMADDVRAGLGPEGEARVFALFDMLHELPKWYHRNASAPITKQELLQRDSHGYCYLDSPSTWSAFAEWSGALAANGEPLTKADMLQPSVDGGSYLEQAARSGAFDKVVEMLDMQGESLAREDLLTPQGEPNGTLKAAVAWGQHGAALRYEQWRDGDPSELQRVVRKLPSSAQEQVGNLHAVIHQLRADREQRAEAGR